MSGGGNQNSFDEASDVTHSTAYNVLNNLVEEGMILGERSDYLKQKFKDLHSRVLTIYKRDNLLLKRARQLRADLDRERDHVHQRGDVAKKDDEEIQKLKRTLIGLEKDLNDAQERESILQVETLEYDRRKQNMILEREDAYAAEAARLRPKMESARAEIADMGAAIKQLLERQTELEEKLVQANRDEATCRAEAANFTAALGQARQQHANIENDPARTAKRLQLVTNSLQATQRELGLAEAKVAAQNELIASLEQQKASRSCDAEAARAALGKIQQDIEAKRKTLAALSTSLEMELETRQGYQDRLAELDLLLKTSKIAFRQEEDGVDRMSRDKARHLKEFGALEQGREDLAHEQQSISENVALATRGVLQVEAARRQTRDKIEEEKKKIEVRTRQLLREQGKEKEFTERANLILEDIADMSERIVQKVARDEVKRRELLALASKRQELNREAAKEGSRVLLVRHEVSSKALLLRKLRHRHQELEKRLGTLMESFQNVKRERSHKTALIQAITQKMTEVGEKTKILENELEVLVREASVKEQELIKKKRQSHEAQQFVAKLRLEKNKLRKKAELAADAEQGVRAHVKRMNQDVASAEDVMIALKDTYTSAIESRNQTGIQLIDRNDTLSLLMEKVKAQERAIEQGTTMTTARAGEMQRLQTALADLLRALEVCQRSVPRVRQLEEELEALNTDMDDERWRMEVLENELTDPNNTHRWRFLEPPPPRLGGGPAPASSASAAAATAKAESGANGVPSEDFLRLQARTQDLESRLGAVNSKLHEKQLILAEVQDLSDRIGARAEAGREVTLALARQMNQFQSGIRGKTRQMMATISELSLFQASSIQLQQEVERLEGIVVEAEQRLQEGSAPFAEAEEEYARQRETTRRYAAAQQLRRAQEIEAGLIGPSTIAPTAEPRPNAYVPEGGLGLPRPFGAMAPFRPTAGASKSARSTAAPAPRQAGSAAAAATTAGSSPTPAASFVGLYASAISYVGDNPRMSESSRPGSSDLDRTSPTPSGSRFTGTRDERVSTATSAASAPEQLRLSQRGLSVTR